MDIVRSVSMEPILIISSCITLNARIDCADFPTKIENCVISVTIINIQAATD